MNIKNGKTKSVGVSPSHSAWSSGAYICPHERIVYQNHSRNGYSAQYVKRQNSIAVAFCLHLFLFVQIIFLRKFLETFHILIPILFYIVPAITFPEHLANFRRSTHVVKHCKSFWVGNFENFFAGISRRSLLHYEKLLVGERRFAVIGDMNLHAANIFSLESSIKVWRK